MKFISYTTLALALLPLSLATAMPSNAGSTFYLQGKITPKSLENLGLAIGSGEVSRIRLSSRGGDMDVTHSLAALIRENDIDTYVGSSDYCFSACVILLASGKNRHLEEGAIVGMHSPYATDTAFLESMSAPDVFRLGQARTTYDLLRTLTLIESDYHLSFIALQLLAHSHSSRNTLYYPTIEDLKEAGIID